MSYKSLTSEQEQLAYEIRDWWIAQFGNLKFNRPVVEEGVKLLYESVKEENPETVIHVQSPRQMQYAAAVLNNFTTAEIQAIPDLDNWVREEADKLYKAKETVYYQAMGCKGSVVDWYWVAYTHFFQELGVEMPALFDLFKNNCCLSGAYDYLLYDTCTIVCEHPKTVYWGESREGNPIIESRTNAALEWADGFKVYKIEDIVVPEIVVVSPHKMDINMIKNENNKELQRIMVEQYGYDAYIEKLATEIVDFDVRGVVGGAARAVIRSVETGQQWLVTTDGSTDRVYHLNPPQDARTCREAHEALCGFDESRIKMEG